MLCKAAVLEDLLATGERCVPSLGAGMPAFISVSS